MRDRGIMASELVKQLQMKIAIYGDQEVIVKGGDYPEGCAGVFVQEDEDDPYIPHYAFVVY